MKNHTRRILTGTVLLALAGSGGCSPREGISMDRSTDRDRAVVVFLGDSITHGGDWNALLGITNAVNKGIPGDTTGDILARIDDAAFPNATHYFIMAGVNDFPRGTTPQQILANLEEILRHLRMVNPNAEYFLQSVLPINDKVGYFIHTNEDILSLNRGIAALAEREHVTYVDVHAAVRDEQGLLKREYTFDGLHLSGAGYQRWAELLMPCLDK